MSQLAFWCAGARLNVCRWVNPQEGEFVTPCSSSLLDNRLRASALAVAVFDHFLEEGCEMQPAATHAVREADPAVVQKLLSFSHLARRPHARLGRGTEFAHRAARNATTQRGPCTFVPGALCETLGKTDGNLKHHPVGGVAGGFAPVGLSLRIDWRVKTVIESMENDPGTIYVVDSDPATSSLVGGLAAEMHAGCHVYASAEEFLEAGYSARPACLVAEFRLPGMCGLALQAVLGQQQPALPAIILTAHAKVSLVVQAMRHGAVTVLEKPAGGQELWEAIREAIALDSRNRCVHSRHEQLRHRLADVTPRERQVLDLIMSGKSNKAIADQLRVSVRTVESRRHQIFKKTQSHSVAELVRLVLRIDSANGCLADRH